MPPWLTDAPAPEIARAPRSRAARRRSGGGKTLSAPPMSAVGSGSSPSIRTPPARVGLGAEANAVPVSDRLPAADFSAHRASSELKSSTLAARRVRPPPHRPGRLTMCQRLWRRHRRHWSRVQRGGPTVEQQHDDGARRCQGGPMERHPPTRAAHSRLREPIGRRCAKSLGTSEPTAALARAGSARGGPKWVASAAGSAVPVGFGAQSGRSIISASSHLPRVSSIEVGRRGSCWRAT